MKKLALAVWVILATPMAHAGGVALLEDDTRIDFEGEQVRLVTADSDGMEMIFRQGRAYAIHHGQVIDISQMMARMGGMLAQSERDNHSPSGQFALRDTGRKESIAGFTGTVYQAETIDANGQKETTEMVLSGHPLVREMTQALIKVSTSMAQGMPGAQGIEQAWMKQNLNQQGVLRVEQDFQVKSLQAKNFPAAHFTLPGKPQAMPSLGNMPMMPGQAPISDPISRQPERARARVDDAVNNTVDRTVDRAVDHLIRGLLP